MSDSLFSARVALLWLPALGVPARKYDRFASALAAHGIALAIHEWRGTGAHPERPSRRNDWGYRELLLEDIPATCAAVMARYPGVPLLYGGHSIGAQFAVMAAALHGGPEGLVAVGSGVPHWRLFPSPLRWLVGAFGHVLPPLTHVVGHYPGHRFRFAGREAGQLMRDWAQTVRRGHYDGLRGLPERLGERIAALDLPFLGLRLADDRLVPAASSQALIAATGTRRASERLLGAADLGVAADHFAWMREPRAVADAIAGWWHDARGGLSP